MPWREVSAVSERCEFVRLACVEGTCIRELCRRFGISPKTGYKWLRRYRASGRSGLDDRSRRPHRSPRRTPATMEARILAVRDRHQPVALRPTVVDGVWALVFCRQVLGHVNLHVNHEPRLLPPGPGPDAEVTEPTGL